jgi:CRP-like cAMP-binding protein
MLEYLSDADLKWMAAAGRLQSVPRGHVLVRQGEDTPSLFILLEGHAVVEVHGLGVIARLHGGEVMGEMSFVDASPPSATVTSEDDCILLTVEKVAVMERMQTDPGFEGRLYKALAIFLANRLRGTVNRMKSAGDGGEAAPAELMTARKSPTSDRGLAILMTAAVA